MDELTLTPGVIATDETLTIPEGYTFEQWKTLGSVLRTIEQANQFWVGDWVNFGDGKFPDMVKQTAKDLGYDEQTIRQYARVARRFGNATRVAPEEVASGVNRRDDLSFGHHLAVAALTPVAANEILDYAEKEHLTVREIEAEVREYKKEHNPPKEAAKKETAFSFFKVDRVNKLTDILKTAKGVLLYVAKEKRDEETGRYILGMFAVMFDELADYAHTLLGNELPVIPEDIQKKMEVEDAQP